MLADVFENFRDTCLLAYELDPAHYLSAPHLSWDAMLKFTKIELDLLSESNMFTFLEKGLRGGVSMISKRYARANNKYLNSYNPDIDSSFIIYLDANNLYGYAMSQPMPYTEFNWLERKDIEKLDFCKIDSDGDFGYILEVDLHYPDSLHDQHNEYPLAPERLLVNKSMLSERQLILARTYNMKLTEISKLIPNLFSKTKYVLHFKLLQLYKSYGMEIGEIYRVLRFRQKPWLRPYIDLNTQRRSVAKSTFEKDFYKLMNNAVYGKTCENLRKRTDVKIVKDNPRKLKLLHKPNCKGFKIFDNNLIAIHLAKFRLTINKPTYVGFCVLELSKHLMYHFHYSVIKSRYGGKASLLFTDTDSLMYHIQTEDVYADLFEQKHLFDFSGYQETSDFFDPSNKKVIGKFKDETNGVPILEFIGLKAKMYSYIKEDQKGSQRGKGIRHQVVEKELPHERYVEQLHSPKYFNFANINIRSDAHTLYTISVRKKGLCSYDDKKYLLPDNVNTLAHGHFRIRARTQIETNLEEQAEGEEELEEEDQNQEGDEDDDENEPLNSMNL